MLIGATSAVTTCVVGNIYFEEKKLQKRIPSCVLCETFLSLEFLKPKVIIPKKF